MLDFNYQKEISGGLFIALYDEKSLKLYLNKGLYGFLMKPLLDDNISPQSRHYSVLADYACSREGTDVFFFIKRKIYYGGKIFGNKDIGSFYINGLNSPLGRKINADLFWDETPRYEATETPGVFKVRDSKKAQPFIFQFTPTENTGKYITSDDLYFELGKTYPYPLPSNSMQGLGFCTLTPGEVKELKILISKSKNFLDYQNCEEISKNGIETLFNEELVNITDNLVNEAQLEFTILSSLKPFKTFLTDNYILCRQVPICPFKPMNMDRADICLYSLKNPIKNGTIPNVIIELKKDKIGATNKAYNQVVRYLHWIKSITTDEEFKQINAFLIAPEFGSIKRNKVDLTFENKIKMFSIKLKTFIELK